MIRASLTKIASLRNSKGQRPVNWSREGAESRTALEDLETADREATQWDLRIRPCSIGDKARLYFSYVLATSVLHLAPHKARSAGFFVPGRSTLKVSVAGILFYARPRTDDLDSLSDEPQTAMWFQPKPGDTVVDVGAHIGRYALLAGKNAANVVAIEPDPTSFSMLEANMKLNGLSNVLPLPIALSRHSGRIRFYPADQGDTSTSSVEPDWGKRTRPAIEVECETLDHLVASLHLRTIDWLKIDVEGHEVAVLEGARSALAHTKRLIVEVAGGHERACRALTEDAGLDIVSTETRMGGFRFSNWLLVRSEPT